MNIDNAFTKFFRDKSGFPRFKSKKNPVQSFNVPQNYKVDFDNSKVYIPRIGWVKTKIHRKFVGKQQTATISKTSAGKYYISILIDDSKSVPDKQPFNESNILGIDLGISHFLITSDNFKSSKSKIFKTEP